MLARLRGAVGVYLLVFSVWVFYRLFFHLPLWFEELFLKGIVFGGPVFLVTLAERRRFEALGLTLTGLFPATYLGILLGMALTTVGLVANVVRHGGEVIFSPYGLTSGTIGWFLILALVTAFWEELFFCGWLLSRLMRRFGSEWVSVGVMAVGFGFIHLPALVLSGLGWTEVGLSLWLLLTLGFANGVLMLRVRNLAAPILAHALWGVSVFLFR